MAATLYPLPVPPIPWHTIGLDYLTHLPKSNGFNNVLIVVDHILEWAIFCRVQRLLLPKKLQLCFYRESAVYID
jgi:hypothetical protein